MGRQIVVEQHCPIDATRTYAAWTSADALARWWWPHIADTTYEVDARAGGRYEIRSEAAGIGVSGRFLELDAPRSIRMTWCWIDDGVVGAEEEVRVAVAPDRDGTLVRVTHDLAGGADGGDDLRQGWHDVLDRLARSLA